MYCTCIIHFVSRSISSSNCYAWGAELQHVLSRDHECSLLTAEQLVGRVLVHICTATPHSFYPVSDV